MSHILLMSEFMCTLFCIHYTQHHHLLLHKLTFLQEEMHGQFSEGLPLINVVKFQF